MKELICSTIERNVVLKFIRDRKVSSSRKLIRNIFLFITQRLDCRTIDETRSVNIEFRSHPGYVSVTLGQTQ